LILLKGYEGGIYKTRKAHISLKIISGDSAEVTREVCQKVD